MSPSGRQMGESGSGFKGGMRTICVSRAISTSKRRFGLPGAGLPPVDLAGWSSSVSAQVQNVQPREVVRLIGRRRHGMRQHRPCRKHRHRDCSADQQHLRPGRGAPTHAKPCRLLAGQFALAGSIHTRRHSQSPRTLGLPEDALRSSELSHADCGLTGAQRRPRRPRSNISSAPSPHRQSTRTAIILSEGP